MANVLPLHLYAVIANTGSYYSDAAIIQKLQQGRQWACYWPNVIILATTETPRAILASLGESFPPPDPATLVILQLGNQVDGRAPKELWQWFTDRHEESHRRAQPINLPPVPDVYRKAFEGDSDEAPTE